LIRDWRESCRRPAGFVELRKSADNHTDLTGKLDQTLDVNSENIDECLKTSVT